MALEVDADQLEVPDAMPKNFIHTGELSGLGIPGH